MKSTKWICLIGVLLLTIIASTQAQSLKLNLSFNQPKYVQGDTAFFRGRLLEGLRPVSGKKVISLRLLDAEGKIRFHNRITFQNGLASNQLALSVRPDQYTLVAFLEDQPMTTPILKMPFVIVGEKKFTTNSTSSNDLLDVNSVNVSVKTDKENYSVRSPVSAQITITDTSNKPLEGDYSVSVFYADLFEESFQKTEGNTVEFNNASKPMSYYFKGKVNAEKAIKDSTLITFYLNKNDFVYPLYINSTGVFEFPLFKDFEDEIVYYTITYKGSKVTGNIALDQPVVKIDSIKTPRLSNEEDKYNSFSKKRNVIMKSFLYYSGKLSSGDEEEWLDSDFDIELDKFEPFSSMPELLGNIVQMVRYRKRESEDAAVRVFLKDNAIYATSDPLYIIDGVMMDNTKFFLNLLPDNIDKIGILRSHATLSRYGELGKSGIILVRTKPTSREGRPTNDHELFITGINKSVQFKSPSYSNNSQVQIPDLRSTLYWNPNILTDNQGRSTFSFYTGDATGNFKIRIEGITRNGLPFIKEIPFTVSYEKP